MYKVKFSAEVDFPPAKESWKGFVSLDEPETLRELETDVPDYTYDTVEEAETAVAAFIGEGYYTTLDAQGTIYLVGETLPHIEDGELWTYIATVRKA